MDRFEVSMSASFLRRSAISSRAASRPLSGAERACERVTISSFNRSASRAFSSARPSDLGELFRVATASASRVAFSSAARRDRSDSKAS